MSGGELLNVSYRPYIAISGLTVVKGITGCHEYIMNVLMNGWIGGSGPVEKRGYVLERMIKR